MDEYTLLTEQNLIEWLKILDDEAYKRIGIKNYSQVNRNLEWLNFEGQSVKEVIDDEIHYSN